MAFRIKRKKLEAPLQSQSIDLPIQFSLIVPTTVEKNKSASKFEQKKRADETKAFLDKSFGGDTTVTAQGGFISSQGKTKGKRISEKVFVVEGSTTKENYMKIKPQLENFIKEKRKAWGQESIAYRFEDTFKIYPK